MKGYFEKNPVRLGGKGVVVQVDETKLNLNVKSHKGSRGKNIWALCIVDTSFTPALGYVEIVKDRSAETLVNIINRVVLQGTVIHSDEWGGYKRLSLYSKFTHKTVCHKEHFVDPKTKIHTQHLNLIITEIIRIKAMKGLNSTQRSNFLIEFMFKERHKKFKFVGLISLLTYLTEA